MKLKITSLMLALVLAVTVLGGCGGSSNPSNQQPKSDTPQNTDAQQPASNNTVVIGIATDLQTLDPGHMYEVFAKMISYATYDMPFKVERDSFTPEPCLVTEDWSVDETGTVYTLPLRQDVKFTSGNPLTSKDVVFSINRVLNLKGNALPYAKGVKSAEAVDDYTVVITLDEPDSSFLTKMTTTAFSIVDSETVKANGGTDAENASTDDKAQAFLDANSAGSGPYKLTSWTKGVELVLERNPDYWGAMGNVDRYIIKEIPDPNTQIQMIESGEIDIAYTLNADNIGLLEGKPGINTVRGRSSICTFLLMNMNEEIGGPMSNPDVQRAVRYAIDYEGLLKVCGEGATLPMSIVPLGFTGALTKDTNFRDLDKAREFMAKAGYPDGFDITLTTASFQSEGMGWPTIAEIIKSDLADININVDIITKDFSPVVAEYRDGLVPFLVMHWNPDYLDLNNQLTFVPGHTVAMRANWPEEANPRMVELANLIVGETNEDLRTEYSEELQRLMLDESPFAFLLQHPKNFAVSDKLSNVYYNDHAKIQLKDIVVN